MIDIYTDGSYSTGTDRGGWSYFMLKGDYVINVRSGNEMNTNNNRMEMRAAIEALRDLEADTATVFTDSANLCRPVREGWFDKWRENGFKNSSGRKVSNNDLWEEMDEVVDDKNITFKKIKGHSGIKYNVKADKLAKAEMAGVELTDHTYTGQPITSSEIRRLWQCAQNSGYLEEGVRFILGEYGIVSTKDITTGIYSEIMSKLQSKTLAKMYNAKAQELTNGRN